MLINSTVLGQEGPPIGRFSKDDDLGSLSLDFMTSGSGILWEKFGDEPLDGWLYGQVEDGTDGNRRVKFIAYIYSDLRTVYFGNFTQLSKSLLKELWSGNFQDKKMVEARATKISRTRYKTQIVYHPVPREINTDLAFIVTSVRVTISYREGLS